MVDEELSCVIHFVQKDILNQHCRDRRPRLPATLLSLCDISPRRGITSTVRKEKRYDLQSKTHFTPACTLQFISSKTKKRRALGKISTSFYQKNTLFPTLNMRNCKTKNIHFWLLSLFTLCAKRRK